MAGEPTYEELKARVEEFERMEHARKKSCFPSPERERDLSRIVYGMAIPTFVIDKNHCVMHWNRACEKLTRISEGDVKGTQDAWKAFYPDKRPVLADLVVDEAPEQRIERHYRGTFSKSELVEGAYEAHSYFPELGDRGKWLFFTATPLRDSRGRIAGAIETFQDITEQKFAEMELAAREAFLKTLVDSMPIPIFYKDRNGRYLGFNRTFQEFLGKTRKEIIGKTPFDITEPGLAKLYHAKDKELFESGGLQQYESQVIDARGVLRDVVFNKAAFRDGNGTISGLIGAIFDITDRKRVETALKENQRQLGTLMGNLPGMVYRSKNDPERTMEFVSDGCLPLTGYRSEDLINNARLPFARLIHPEDLQAVSDVIREALADLRTFQVDYRILTAENEEKWVMEKGQAITGDEGKTVAVEGFITDITHNKMLESQLRQAQKMEAIGTLSGGIAHDFNNILSSIFGFTELAKMRLAGGEDVEKDLDEVMSAGYRARGLVKQILAFSRQAEIEKTPIVIGPLVKESLKLLRATLPTTIEMKVDVEASSGTVLADPSQIHQILMNLCTNAAQAMEPKGGGTLVIQLKEIAIGCEDTPYKDLEAGDYVRLSVCDTGGGIQKECMDKVFDPFFTTKKRGEGTGLGLSVVHGIVTEMGGLIRFESGKDTGTTFDVLFPMHESADNETDPYPHDLVRGRGRILFVDDEEAIVSLGKGILNRLGYEVVTTTSSPEALEIFRAERDDFDLVLTDMTMPRMTGLDLSEQILKIRPDIPIVLCTGFSAGLTKEVTRSIGIRDIIMKPMIAGELAGAVASALNLK